MLGVYEMKNIYVVIGSNFGDEGKGLITDYISKNKKNSLVIRFNGGAQAGHTVVLNESNTKSRHIFSHFGSGTLQGLPTYLSKYFILNPMLFNKEYYELKNFNIKLDVFVHKDSLVTTPYDVMINQIAEIARGEKRHGSCGVGFNETIKRNESNEEFKITTIDLSDKSKLLNKLTKIKEIYFFKRLKELNIEKVPSPYIEYLDNDNIILSYLDDIYNMLNRVTIVDNNILDNYNSLIFEGAQGLLLDKNSIFFPNVTHSNTGVRNVLKILNDKLINYNKINLIYVTRAYMTRHGAGKFPTELKRKPYAKIQDSTNIFNEFQGKFRYGLLDLNLLKETILNDLKHFNNEKFELNLGVTCIDQLNDYIEYFINNKKHKDTVYDFIKILFNYLNIKKGYLSYGSSNNDIFKFTDIISNTVCHQ
jgi:adenylosuccinate synthase